MFLVYVQVVAPAKYPDHICKAYDTCFALEKKVVWSFGVNEEILSDKLPPQIAGRVLGHALILAPTETSRDKLAKEISDCEDDDTFLASLAYLYIFGLIRAFHNPKGPIPAVSISQSPLHSSEVHPNSMETTLTHKPGHLRDMVMKRDNYRCAFTGDLDATSVEQGLVQWNTYDSIYDVQVAHIISQSLASDIRLQWASTVAAIIERFDDFKCEAILGEDFLRNPLNAILATPALHARFDQLRIWFTAATDNHGNIISDSTYDINTSIPRAVSIALRIQDQVTFTTPQLFIDGQNISIAPPHKRLLEIHVACAQIARMSGAAQVLDEFARELEPFSLTVDSRKMDVNSKGLEELRRALYNIQPTVFNNLDPVQCVPAIFLLCHGQLFAIVPI
ncbi:hypothetical protein C8Q75DRAFT_811583 [Abortiporus biennis]|nr:hypothetical protein C8Q75DRAFT_811583 [Abortiporus biennis]